ncbi:MAG: hypothetical protein ACRC5T_04190 [Cetobacterium sp.]
MGAINKDSLITAGGSKFVNFTNGVMRITVIGEDCSVDQPVDGLKFVGDVGALSAKPHKLAIYSAEVSIPDTGIAIPLDTIMGRTRDINDIFNTKGSYAGSTMGNEQLNTTDMSLGFTEDYVYLSDNPQGHIVSRDILRSMLSADSIGINGKIIKIAGTNGSVKRGREASSDRYFGGLFVTDGKIVVPQASDSNGESILESNTRVSAYNTSALTVMLEFLYTFSAEETNGFRFTYALNGGFNYQEGDDVNKVTCTSQILCDPRTIKDFWINGDAPGCGKIQKDKLLTLIKTDDVATSKQVYIDAIDNNGIIIENKNGPVVLYSEDADGNAGYILLAGDVPVPAYIGDNGANPDLTSLETLELAKPEHYRFEIYDFDLTNASFKPHKFVK